MIRVSINGYDMTVIVDADLVSLEVIHKGGYYLYETRDVKGLKDCFSGSLLKELAASDEEGIRAILIRLAS